MSLLTFFYTTLLLHDILYRMYGNCTCLCRMPTVGMRASAWSLFYLFFSCAGRSGRTGEPGEGIVDVAVGRLAHHGSTPQYLALCGGMTVLSSPASPVSL